MAGVLEIDRVPLSLLAATTPDRAELLQRRVCDAVSRSLPGALAAACGRTLESGDAYVFIDRLRVECAVAAEWSDDGIARALAQEIAGALDRTPEAAGAVTFRDRDEYVAAFLMALVDGRAFSCWWFGDFSGLAMLTTSSAIRTAIVSEGEGGLRSLVRLTGDSLRRLLETLSDHDAQRVLTHVIAIRATVTAAPGVRAFWQILDMTPPALLRNDARRALYWAVALEREREGSANAVSLERLNWLHALHAAIHHTSSASLPIHHDAERQLIEWAGALGIDAAPAQSLTPGERLDLVERVRAVASERCGPAGSENGTESFAVTRYGGVVLLGGLLARLGWWGEWRQAALRAGRDPDEATRSAARLALAVAARALAPDTPAATAGDPVIRQLFGAATEGMPPPRRARRLAAALLRALADRLPGCDGASPGYLRTQVLAFPGRIAFSPLRIEVRVGRPPLDVLLSLAGFKRNSVLLPDGRTLAILPEDTP